MSLDHDKTATDSRVGKVAAYLSHYPVTKVEVKNANDEDRSFQEALETLLLERIAAFTAAEIAKNPEKRAHFEDIIDLVEGAIYETFKSRLEREEMPVNLEDTWQRAAFVTQEILRELAWIRGQNHSAPLEQPESIEKIMDELDKEIAAIREKMPMEIVEELLVEEIA